MRICDKCRLNGDTVQATDKVKFQGTDEEADLCLSCTEEVRDFIHGSERDNVVIGSAKGDRT